MYNVAFRVLRNNEQYKGCITAKDPNAQKTLGWYIHYGKSMIKLSQYIAATLDFRIALSHAVKDDCARIAVINLDGLFYFDNSTKEKALKNVVEKGKKQKWLGFVVGTAAASEEIDFERSIPADHYFVITTGEVLGYLKAAMQTGQGIGVLNWLLLHHKFGENK